MTNALAASRRRRVLLPAAALAIAVLLPLAVFLGAAVLLGWRLQVIETNSMAPAHPAGSLAIVEPLDTAAARPGMAVVFEDPLVRGRFVAHRLVKRLPSRSVMWATKGDANAENDPAPVAASAIQGRVRWAVPGLGRTVSALPGAWAAGLLVGLPLIFLLVSEVVVRRRRREPVAG